MRLRTQVTFLCVSLFCLGLVASRATTASNLPRVQIPLNRDLAGCRPDYDSDGDGFSECDDCNDNDDTVWPGAPEICDGKDNDCNAVVDEGLSIDLDGDGFTSISSCNGTSDDCDDNDGVVWPGAPEICDGKDNDCDGGVDEGCAVAVKAHTWSVVKQLFR